jgi:hypothetical protein
LSHCNLEDPYFYEIFFILVSYNQPKFCPFTSWNPNAITFANNNIIGLNPTGIFVNTNNTVYAADRENGRIQIWLNDDFNPTRTILVGSSDPRSIFVAITGDIYVDNGGSNGRVDKWTFNTNTSVPVMYVNSSCFGLFLDINDTLYCSMYNRDQVVKRWLNDETNTSTPAAGTGIAGSDSNMLSSPYGIFVDINFDLYVAHCQNHRIQHFRSGQLNATTIAGDRSSDPTIRLTCPTGIVLDADRYLFIVDYGNHRIVGSGPNGFRCLVGCFGRGSASNQLDYPATLSFDSYGNMFVTDWDNHRVQKFLLSTNSCSKYKNIYLKEQ